MSKKDIGLGLQILGVGLAIASAGASTPFTAALYAGGAAAASLGSAQLAAGAARDAAKRAASRAASEAARGRAVEGTAIGGDNAHGLVFGRARVGGVLMNTGTGAASNTVLERTVAHSISHAGGIQGVGAIYINGVAIDTTNAAVVTLNAGSATETRYIDSTPTSGVLLGMLKVRTFLGLHTQVLPSIGEAGALSDYARGIAYSVFTFTRDLANDAAFQLAYSGGIPDASIEVLGLKCYDPRLDSTRGGSGAQRADQPLSWTYTDNPALQALSYLIMRPLDGGCGRPLDQIDYAAFAASATANEVQIGSGTTVNKYRSNGVLTTEDECDTNLDRLVGAMMGWWWEEGGLFKVQSGGYQTPSATITDDWLSTGFQIENGSGLDALYNAVRITYKSPASAYNALEAFPFTNAAYEAEDGGRQLFRDVTAALTTDEINAQYLAQVEGRRSREQRRIGLTTNLRGLGLSVGQSVLLSLDSIPEACGSNVYLVKAKNFVLDVDGGLALQFALEEHRLDTYTPTAFGVASTTGSYPDIYESPTWPTAFAVTAVADGAALSWVSPAATTYAAIEVEVATVVSGPYTPVVTALKADCYTHPTTTGALLYFRLRARNAQGQFSPYSSVISSAGKTVANGADVSMQQQFAATYGWHFLTTTEGYTASGATLTLTDGLLRLTATSSNPNLVSSIFSFSGARNPRVRMRVRRTAGSGWQGKLYYVTAGHGMSDSFTKAVANTTLLNQFVILEWDMAALTAGGSDWINNSILQVRFDLGNSSADVFEVDWIAIGDLGAVNSVDGTAEGQTYGRDRQDILTNGRPDLAKALPNRSASYISETATLRWAAESGANITESRTSLDASNLGGRAAGTVRDESRTGYNVTAPGSGQRVGDQRNVPNLATGGLRSYWVNQSITATFDSNSPANFTVSITAAQLRIGSVAVSYNALSTSGQLSRGSTTTLYLFLDDASYAGGAQTMGFATNFADLFLNDARIYVGAISITVPAGASSGGSAGTGGGGACVTLDSLDPEGRVFGSLQIGDWLLLGDQETLAESAGQIQLRQLHLQPCLEIVCENGAALQCSRSAPLAAQEGGCTPAEQITVGAQLATLVDGVTGYSPVASIRDIGEQLVLLLYVQDRCFWAGKTARACLLHHNAKAIG